MNDYPTLTARQLEVLNLISQGMANKAIAAELNISYHTAKFHVDMVIDIMAPKTRTRTEAAVAGVRLGII